MHAFFPIEFGFGDRPSDGIGGKPVENAATIYFCCDQESLGDYIKEYDDQCLLFKTTVDEIIDSFLEDVCDYDGVIDDDYVPAAEALALALRSAADRLDAAKNRQN